MTDIDATFSRAVLSRRIGPKESLTRFLLLIAVSEFVQGGKYSASWKFSGAKSKSDAMAQAQSLSMFNPTPVRSSKAKVGMDCQFAMHRTMRNVRPTL